MMDMRLLILSLVCLAPLASSTKGGGGGGGGYGNQGLSAYLQPIYVQGGYEDQKTSSGFGDFFGGFNSFFKGSQKESTPPNLIAFHAQPPAPSYHPPPYVEPQVVEVQVPKCEPLTHYITNFVTETVPFPVIETEFVQNVVPTVVYQTQFQRQVETEYVTDILTQRLVSTYTRSIAVPRNTFITQTETALLTSNIIQRTTEVNFSPVFRTRFVTVTATDTITQTNPDVRISHAIQTVRIPTTAYVTETKIQLQPSLVLETTTAYVTQISTEYRPQLVTVTSPPEYITTTQYNHVTTSIYEAARPPAVVGPITVTQQVKEYIPTVSTYKKLLVSTAYEPVPVIQTVYKTQYVTDTAYHTQYVTKTEYIQKTHVITEYVTVQPQCGVQYGYVATDPLLSLSPALQHVGDQAAFVATSPQIFSSPNVIKHQYGAGKELLYGVGPTYQA
ncbi:uncharacterized protein [Palaemon carinicauda]|uniref:uncharacterized protein n=1 Tax=Palaemon carinicauda TaxID=392227 RepID=UPI0035B61B97